MSWPTSEERAQDEQARRALAAELAEHVTRDRAGGLARMRTLIADAGATPTTRSEAARVLAAAVHETDLAALAPLLGGADDLARGPVAELFARLGRRAFGERGPGAASPLDRDALTAMLVPLLAHPDPEVRFVACACLREYAVGGPPRAQCIAALGALATGPVSPVRALAAVALPRNALGAPAREAILVACLDSPHRAERLTALRSVNVWHAAVDASSLRARLTLAAAREPEPAIHREAVERCLALDDRVAGTQADAEATLLTAAYPPLRWVVAHAPDGDLAAASRRRWLALESATVLIALAAMWATPRELARALSVVIRRAADASPPDERDEVEPALAALDAWALGAAPDIARTHASPQHGTMHLARRGVHVALSRVLLRDACRFAVAIGSLPVLDVALPRGSVLFAVCACRLAAARAHREEPGALAAIAAVERELADLVRAALPPPPLARTPGPAPG